MTAAAGTMSGGFTRIGLLILLLLLVIAVAAIWIWRRSIADNYIRDELEKRGVAATYQLDRVGFRTQQVSNLVIGDPSNPDLTVRRAVIQLKVQWNGSFKVYRVAARGVRLKGRMVGNKVSWGQVDKLLPPPTRQAVHASGPHGRPERHDGRTRIAIWTHGLRGRWAWQSVRRVQGQAGGLGASAQARGLLARPVPRVRRRRRHRPPAAGQGTDRRGRACLPGKQPSAGPAAGGDRIAASPRRSAASTGAGG